MNTAANRPGKYQIEAELNGKKVSAEIQIDPGAPSRRPREKTSFSRESGSRDPRDPTVPGKNGQAADGQMPTSHDRGGRAGGKKTK